MAGPEVTVAIIAELQRRSIRAATTELDKEFKQRDVEIGADVKAAEIKAAAEKIKREFADIRAQVKVDVDTSATGKIREIGNAARDTERAVAGVGRASASAAGGLSEIGKTGFQSARGVLALGIALGGIPLLEAAQDAVTASQSIFLLPAAATAAAAGIGTLKLATMGFDQAMKDMRDPEKFANDLALLSPNAQQAALSLRNLLPLFDQLKNATQDAFFNNVAGQINQLATTYEPVIQNMTTSIARTFNTAMGDVGSLLMQPGTQGQIAEIATNIGAAFQNAEPAVRSFSQAFLDIAQVGSQFLPGLGTSISEVAANFAAFIREARDSGQLQVWIQQGIDAAKLLGQAIWDIGQFIYKTFGADGQKNIDEFKRGLGGVNEVLAIMRGDFSQTGASITDQLQQMSNRGSIWEVGFQQNVQSVRNAFADIPEFFQTITNGVIDALNEINHAVNFMAGNATKALDHILPGKQEYTNIPDIPHVRVGNWGDASPAPFAPGQHSDRNVGGAAPPGKYRTRYGEIRPLPSGDPNAPGGAPWSPIAVPPPTGAPGTKPSDRERLDAIKAGLDPNSYKVDPFAPVPGLPSPGALAGGPMPGGGYGAASAQDFFAGQQDIVTKAHDLEEKRKDRLALERDNQSTAEQINDAKWQEHLAEVDLQKAQAALVDKTKGTAQALKTSTEALSAGLDPDLGLSKGLSGFVDNMVRFAGHMALAGPMAQMNQTVNANAAATGITGGYGLLGIQGAQNLSQGLSPLLGQPMDTTGTGTASTAAPTLGSSVGSIATGTGGAAYGLPAGTNTGGYGTGTSAVFPPWVMALAQQYGVTPSTYPGHQESNRNEPGYAPNPQHLNRGIDWTGTPDAMQRFAQAMAADPLAEQVIYNGTSPVEAVAGQARPGYFAGDLAAHGNHVHTRFSQDPTGGLSGTDPAAAGSASGYSSAGLGGSIPIPLPVTIVGGGAGGGLGIGGGGAAPGVNHGLVAAGGGGGHLANWDAIAGAESGNNWGINTGNGFHGGLQFTPGSWAAAGGTALAPSAELATPEQQKTIADQLLQMQGPGAWPATSAAHPEWFASGSGAPLAPGGGQGPILPQYQPGVGAGLSNAPTVPGAPGIGGALGTVPPTQYGGVEPPSNPGGGGMGITPGGTIDSAIQMAASAFPGVGQAAATGMKLANRAIQYGGQMAGIGVEGLMQTFLPTGGSELASNSWLTRIVGGLAGASPALPNLAGKQTAAAQAQAPLTPQQVTSGGGAPGVGAGLGAPITVNYTAQGATEDRHGVDIAHNLSQINQPTPVAGHR